MAISIRQQVIDAIVTTLDAMSVATGYNLEWSLNGGAQPLRNRNELLELPAVLVLSEGDSRESQDIVRIHKSITVACIGYLEWPRETGVDDLFDIGRAIDDAAADIEKAMIAENANDPPLGVAGVEEVTVPGFAPGEADSGHLIADVTVRVQYRHNVYDPAAI